MSEKTKTHPGFTYNRGCRCHEETFCPDLVFSHYEDDVPVYKQASSPKEPRP